jgi:hypothetical protein
MRSAVFASVLTVIAQVALGQAANHALPTGVVLLPGFVHEPLEGIDSKVGRISKEDGLTVFYDIGEFAGAYATGNIATGDSGSRLWLKTYKHLGHRVDVTLVDTGRLVVSFTYDSEPFFANFMGTVDNDEEIAEFLVMVMGYRPD